jgi:6-phosphogluconolactonase (cycloisomerase 2 family)
MMLAAILLGATQARAAGFLYAVDAGQDDISQYTVGSVGGLTPITPQIVATENGATDIAVTPDSTSAYVTNLFADTVSQYTINRVDGSLIPKTPAAVTAGTAPSGIAVTPDGRSVYVLNSADDTVSQYDVDPVSGALTHKLPQTVSTGRDPVFIAVTPDGKSAYVANFDDSTISQYTIDPTTGALTPKTPATVATGPETDAIAVTPGGKNVYVAGLGPGFAGTTGTVSQYTVAVDGTLTPSTPATVETDAGASAIAVSPDGKTAYTADSGGNDITQYGVDPTTGALSFKFPENVNAGNAPTAIALTTGSAYVANYNDNTLSLYDVSANGTLTPKAPATVATAANPDAIALSCPVFACSVLASGHLRVAANRVVIITRLTQPTHIGILVQRIIGNRLLPVGRVPLGLHRKGRVRIRWDLRVNGQKLPRGRYLITLRALTNQQQVIARATLGALRIH